MSDPTYSDDCNKCNYQLHYCGGCGDPLRHDGKTFDGTKHEECWWSQTKQ